MDRSWWFCAALRELLDLANGHENPLYTEAARKSVFHSIAERIGLSPILMSFINLLMEKSGFRIKQTKRISITDSSIPRQYRHGLKSGAGNPAE